jgi:serine protease inhibitor
MKTIQVNARRAAALFTFIMLISALAACGGDAKKPPAKSGAGSGEQQDNGKTGIANEPRMPALAAFDPRVAAAANAFGLSLFTASVKGRESDNLIVSPLSAMLALAMSADGASGATNDEMRKALGLSGISEKDSDEAFRLLTTALNTRTDATVKLANSLWGGKQYPVADDYKSRLKASFDAAAFTRDLEAKSTADEINKWVSDKTGGKIPAVLDEIPANVVLYVINALYFKGEWKTKFNETWTQKMAFITCGDKPSAVGPQSHAAAVEIPMMGVEANFRSYRADNATLVELPYRQSGLSLVAVLPDRDTGLAYVREKLAKNWPDWVAKLLATGTHELEVRFPKFRLESNLPLNDPLASMGMKLPFDEAKADFSRAFPGTKPGQVYVNRVIHSTFIEINEAGTEAAAATVVESQVLAAPPSEEFDRPFFFAIIDNTSGVPLFFGQITNPAG